MVHFFVTTEMNDTYTECFSIMSCLFKTEKEEVKQNVHERLPYTVYGFIFVTIKLVSEERV